MNLRPYQHEACGAAWDVTCRGRSPLVVMPTGTGKSVVLTMLAGKVVSSRKRVLVLAHRRELVDQLVRHLERSGLSVGVEMGDLRSDSGWFGADDVIVASKDSLKNRLRKFDPKDFGLIITDEAHHATARSYRTIYRYFDGVPHCGVTATPDRADKIGLGTVFDEVAFEYGIREAIDDGWLVPLRQVRVSVQDMDFSNVKARGDLTDNQVAEIIKSEAVLHAMVGPMVREVGDSRCLMFLPRVDVAKAAVGLTNRPSYGGHGSAEVVWGEMDDHSRANTFDRFARGDIRYLANVAIATEGWDDPATDGHGVQHLAMMRPTKSRALYAQAVGRILRPLPGTVDGIDTAEGRKAAIAMSNKPQAVVIDFVGNSGKHELVYAADILGGKAPAEVIRRVKEQPDSELTVDEQIAKAEDELLKEQQEIERIKRAHAKHREHIAAEVKYRTVAVDPFTKVRFDDSNPVRPAAIGEGTWRVLRGANVPMSHIRAMTAEQAGAAAQWCMASRKRGGPTWKQAATLRRFGHNPDVMTFGEAKKELDVLAKNNWRKEAV